MMVILWGATAIQLIGVRKIGRIAEWLFILGIALPVVLLIISFFVYVAQGHPLHMVINWNTVIPHKLNGSTLVDFVPFMLAFCGGELQLLTLKTWIILVLIQKLCLLWPLQLSALTC